MLDQLATVDVITCWGTLLGTEDQVYAALEALDYDPDLYLVGGEPFKLPEGYADVEFVHCGGILNTPMIVLAVSGTVQVTKIYRPRKIAFRRGRTELARWRESVMTARDHLRIDADFDIGQLIFGRQW